MAAPVHVGLCPALVGEEVHRCRYALKGLLLPLVDQEKEELACADACLSGAQLPNTLSPKQHTTFPGLFIMLYHPLNSPQRWMTAK